MKFTHWFIIGIIAALFMTGCNKTETNTTKQENQTAAAQSKQPAGQTASEPVQQDKPTSQTADPYAPVAGTPASAVPAATTSSDAPSTSVIETTKKPIPTTTKPSAGKYNLINKFKANETWAYSMSSETILPQGKAVTTLNYTKKVQKLNSDGSANVEMTFTKANILMPGMKADQNPLQGMVGTKTVLLITPDGAEKPIEGAGAQTGATQTASLLPKKPVSIGESWETTQNINGVKVTVISKLVKIETKNGRKTAKVTATMTSEKNPEASINGNMTSWYDMENGWLIKSTSSLKFSGMQGEQKMNLNVTMNLTGKKIK